MIVFVAKRSSREGIFSRIGYWRELRGMSQKELAAILHVSVGTVRRWELGWPAKPEMYPLIAKALRRKVDDLFF